MCLSGEVSSTSFYSILVDLNINCMPSLFQCLDYHMTHLLENQKNSSLVLEISSYIKDQGKDSQYREKSKPS